MHHACVLLGSNIEPENNIPKAVELLQEHLIILRASSIWKSASEDCCYPNYLNLAVEVETHLDAQQLKYELLRPLEAGMGRVRTEDKNASRPIDFDIILFDGIVLDSSLWEHVHRAVPVAELYPGLCASTGESLHQVAQRLERTTPIQLRQDISISIPPGNKH